MPLLEWVKQGGRGGGGGGGKGRGGGGGGEGLETGEKKGEEGGLQNLEM